jgi:octaprenyl-diphosphate synthase
MSGMELPAAAAGGVPPEIGAGRYAHLHGCWEDVHREYRSELAVLQEGLRTAAQGSAVSSAVTHLLGAGGKRVRPLLSWLCAQAVGGSAAEVAPIALASELLHGATLLHDDVLDDAAQRRGVPAARILFGNRLSILAGDLLMTRALEIVAGLARPALVVSFSRCLADLVEGEVLQDEHCFRADVGETVYRRIVELKTASLFGWTAEAATEVAGADHRTVAAFGRFGRGIGAAFQMLDDWLDWRGQPALVGKAVRADLKEGKPSLAVIYGVQTSARVRAWLRDHLRADAPAPTDEAVNDLGAELAQCGALERVREVVGAEVTRAVTALPRTAAPAAADRLALFAELLVGRDH